jgi:murein DD-endopeptidase MepM/ murein hydrolase activator NlpD
MIESHTKLPPQESGPTTVGERARAYMGAVARGVQEKLGALPTDQVAETLQQSGNFVGQVLEETQLRGYLTRGFGWVKSGIGDGSLLNRFALHLVVVLLALGVVSVAKVSLPELTLFLPTPTPAPVLGEHSVAPVQVTTNRGGGSRFVSNSASLFQAPVPHTTIAERDRMAVITYTVQPNDNVWAIAQGFGLKAETVLWANAAVEQKPDLLRVGQKLIIPPVDGIYYTVQSGDTVESLAKKYKTSVEKIVGFELNELQEPYALMPGQKVMLVDGSKPLPKPANYYPMTRVGSAPSGAAKGSGTFAWPTRGLLTQRFWSGHSGIDIANSRGTPIYAADGGYVVAAGRDTWGYGNQVVIDHGNGFKTRYAHLERILVKAGQSVSKNDKIATMGNTGRSTGPHLHFEVIRNDVFRNPQPFLP